MNTDHSHEILLTIFPRMKPVSITLAARASPSPETTTFSFFFADRALAWGIYDGVVVAERACIDVG
jgi:hypothetical protein